VIGAVPCALLMVFVLYTQVAYRVNSQSHLAMKNYEHGAKYYQASLMMVERSGLHRFATKASDETLSPKMKPFETI
ncbi:MAG: hypothetical protein IIY04_01140, partial [Oscillospiraceae bacterium]|nr:hypothetical protein [Oscillospiraceae bacterium]